MIRGKISRLVDRKNSLSISLDIFPYVPPFLTILSVCGATILPHQMIGTSVTVVYWIGLENIHLPLKYDTQHFIWWFSNKHRK